MDEVTFEEVIMSEHTAEVLATINELMVTHNITLEQAFHVMCLINLVPNDGITAEAVVGLYNKGLLKDGKVAVNKAFPEKKIAEKEAQLELDMKVDVEPIGTEETLSLAHKIEKQFVPDKYLDDTKHPSKDVTWLEYMANMYFKGDTTITRYYLIFRALFPKKDKSENKKWNKHFGFTYDGITLWDSSMLVAKKFLSVYRKVDMGIFILATYEAVKDGIDFEHQKSFMQKPGKFLNSYHDYLLTAVEKAEKLLVKSDQNEDSSLTDEQKELMDKMRL